MCCQLFWRDAERRSLGACESGMIEFSAWKGESSEPSSKHEFERWMPFRMQRTCIDLHVALIGRKVPVLRTGFPAVSEEHCHPQAGIVWQ